MINEVTEKEQVRKTVPVRVDLKKPLHKRLKSYHFTMPRSMMMSDTLNEIIEKGLTALGA